MLFKPCMSSTIKNQCQMFNMDISITLHLFAGYIYYITPICWIYILYYTYLLPLNNYVRFRWTVIMYNISSYRNTELNPLRTIGNLVKYNDNSLV